MSFDIVATVFCYFFIKETRGQNLEVAAGTEWEVVETKSEILDDEKGASGSDGLGGLKRLDVVDVRDNFHVPGFKHRS